MAAVVACGCVLRLIGVSQWRRLVAACGAVWGMCCGFKRMLLV